MGGESGQIIDALALPEELDGDAGALLNGQHEAALRGAVELGQDEGIDDLTGFTPHVFIQSLVG